MPVLEKLFLRVPLQKEIYAEKCQNLEFAYIATKKLVQTIKPLEALGEAFVKNLEEDQVIRRSFRKAPGVVTKKGLYQT